MFDIVQRDLLECGVAGQGAVNIWSCLSVSVHRYGIYCIGISAHGQYVANTADYHEVGPLDQPKLHDNHLPFETVFQHLVSSQVMKWRQAHVLHICKKCCHAVVLVENMNVHRK